MLSLEGRQLGNYDVIRRMRVGGMGAVYEGRQRTAFDRRVAIKVILGDYATEPDMRRRFAREAHTIARLHHPHILPLIEFGDERGILYLVMPFIDGGTLTSYLRHYVPSLEEVSTIYQQLLDAVEYAHEEGLIHRDIKSSNVLLEEQRSGPAHIYLADFGLVRSMKQAERTQVGRTIPLDQVPGTPHYMAPEQTRGIVTPLIDIYALGVLLYQMLTGELPYDDPDDIRVIQMHLHDTIPSPSDHDASIPVALDEVVRTAMAKHPEARYANVAELREAFLAAVVDPGVVEEDDAPIIEEDTYIPPKRHTPTPLTLHASSASPVPLILAETATVPRRVRSEPSPPMARRTNRQHDADTLRHQPRITEEPALSSRKRQHHKLWMVATILVSLILIALLLMPRLVGISLFPAGFPVLGTRPVATLYITGQSKMLQDQYVLTASPQAKVADLVMHTIPDRILQDSVSNSSTVQTTGTKTIPGAQAHGNVTFTNVSNIPVNVPTAQVLITAAGVHIQTTQSVNVPPHVVLQDGMASAPAVAVDPGVGGNIAADALNSACCNTMLTARNTEPFTGGADAQVMHIVNQADLDGVQTSLQPRLQRQVQQELQKMVQSDEEMAGPPDYQVSVTENNPVGAQTEMVQVTVKVDGTIAVYNRTLATRTAIQLLRAQAIQTLDSNYQLQGDLSASAPTMAAGKDGIIYVSITVHGLWVYTLLPQRMDQWRQAVKGATSAAALAYLKAQPGITAVHIDLPFGADHLPTSSNDINVVTLGQ